eukprot:12673233-Ditylum_brightwellii.AAC.1
MLAFGVGMCMGGILDGGSAGVGFNSVYVDFHTCCRYETLDTSIMFHTSAYSPPISDMAIKRAMHSNFVVDYCMCPQWC